MQHPGFPILLTVAEVAELLGWRADTVYRRTKEGHLPCVKIGKRRFFHREKLAAFLLSGGAVPTIDGGE